MRQSRIQVRQSFRASESAREYFRRPLRGRPDDEHKARHDCESLTAFHQLLDRFGHWRIEPSHLRDPNSESDAFYHFQHRTLEAVQIFSLGPDCRWIESISFQSRPEVTWQRLRVGFSPLEAELGFSSPNAHWRVGMDERPALALPVESGVRMDILPHIHRWILRDGRSDFHITEAKSLLEDFGLSITFEGNSPGFLGEIGEDSRSHETTISLRPLTPGLIGFACNSSIQVLADKLVIDREKSQVLLTRRTSGKNIHLELRGLPFGNTRIADIAQESGEGDFEFEYTLGKHDTDFTLRDPLRARALCAEFFQSGQLRRLFERVGDNTRSLDHHLPFVSSQLDFYHGVLKKAAMIVKKNHHLLSMATFFNLFLDEPVKISSGLSLVDRNGLELDAKHPSFLGNTALFSVLQKNGFRMATEKYVRAFIEGNIAGLLLEIPHRLTRYSEWFKFQDGILIRCPGTDVHRAFRVITNYEVFLTTLLMQSLIGVDKKSFQTEGVLTLPHGSESPLHIVQIQDRSANQLNEIPGISGAELLKKIQEILDEGEEAFKHAIERLRAEKQPEWMKEQSFDPAKLLSQATQGLLLMHPKPGSVL